jgi:hypothetical protein
VEVAGQVVRFTRPGLAEEYSVSMDGVRQDFVVPERPPGDGQLEVQLEVSGAWVEQTTYGAQLVLEKSGRRIAYSRIRATDAKGRDLSARMEVVPVAAEMTRLKARVRQPQVEDEKSKFDQSLLTSAATSARLAIVLNDADAVYPVRIDPTFSDANWNSMGGYSRH